MNRIIRLSSVLVLAFALVLLGYALWSPPGASAAPFPDFPVGQTRVVNFDAQIDSLEGMTRREQLDQLRDWLLFATVSASGLSPDQINQSIFDLPAIRRGYMQKVANFDYGETRSCLLSDGRAVALIPRGSAEERAARLAHIADEQRKNQGTIPDTILVFEYGIDSSPGLGTFSASLTRQDSVSGRELFTEKYGYFESRISSLEDLRQFMGRIDDITYARTDGGLALGGRRMPGRPYRGIRVEDVAAIWQSATGTKSPKAAGSIGFSLDPAYDFEGLKKEFDTNFAPALRLYLNVDSGFPTLDYSFEGGRFVSRSPKALIEAASSGLGKRDIEPFMNLLNHIEEHKTPSIRSVEERLRRETGLKNLTLAGFLLRDIGERFGFQAARYDGALQGTEVGMVLFYTDLTAKLWSFDFKGSAPRKAIRDFIPDTARPVSSVYEDELERLTQTRLWFGPQNDGFQVADAGKSILFARTATRIYSASATALRPDAESEANALTAPLMDWWDDHYEEIARYEPEYQRLNEIMKWSLLISWLNERHRGYELNFLTGVQVDRSNWFPDWASKRDLRFRDWKKIGFYERGHKGSSTETLPILKSDSFKLFGRMMFMKGGVSLADETVFAGRAALSAETRVAGLARRSNLNYGASSLADEAVSFEGTAYKFTSLAPDRALVTAAAKEGAKLRSAYGELANLKFERVVAREPSGLRVSTRAGDVEIGNLEIGRRPNGFEIGWRSRDIDRGHALARRLSAADDPHKALWGDANVEAVIDLGGGRGHLIKLNGSGRWLELTRETNAASGTWQSRVGGFSEQARSYDMAWKTHDEIQSVFAAADEIAVSPVRGTEGAYQLRAASGGRIVGGQQIELRSGNAVIKGALDPKTGELRFRLGELPESVRRDPAELQRLVAQHMSRGGAPSTRFEAAGGNPLFQQLRSGDSRSLLRGLIDAPADFKARAGRELTEGVAQSDSLLSSGRYRDAVRQIDALVEAYGERPELLLRRGAAKLSAELPEASGPIREALSTGGAKDPALFFREINARIRAGRVLSEDAALVTEGGDLSIHFRLNSLAGRATVSPADLRTTGKGVLVYVEDRPGLNNLDWNVSIHRSLQQAISGDLGTVVRLPRGDIARLRPTLIYAPDQTTSFRAAGQAGTNTGFRYPRYYAGPDDEDEEDDEREEEYIYIVLAKRP